MARVSVIIPMYNGSQYISSAVQSARNQTFEDLEILLVDDASTDGTLTEVEPHLTDRRLKLIRNSRNLGIPATKNKALGLATGEYIAFLDQDDIWLPNKIEAQLSILTQQANIGLMASAVYFINERGDLIGKKILDVEETQPPLGIRRLLRGNFITNSSAMIRRSCVDKVGYFNENLRGSDDYDMWVRIAEHYGIYYLKKVLIKKRLHNSNFSEQNINMMLQGKLTIINSTIKRNPVLAGELRNFSGHVYRSVAIKYAVRGQNVEARKYFFHALKSGNRSFITLAACLLSFLSPGIFAKVTYLGQSAKRRFGFNFL
jgi:glycosyltransferase involved in cell wall biosynthesis